MEYKLNNPYIWTGGECPLPEDSRVTVVYEDGSPDTYILVQDLCWDHSEDTCKIIFFTPTYIPQKPRSVFVNEFKYVDGKDMGPFAYDSEELAERKGRLTSNYVRTIEFVEKVRS